MNAECSALLLMTTRWAVHKLTLYYSFDNTLSFERRTDSVVYIPNVFLQMNLILTKKGRLQFLSCCNNSAIYH